MVIARFTNGGAGGTINQASGSGSGSGPEIFGIPLTTVALVGAAVFVARRYL